MPVVRHEMATSDMAVIADLTRRIYLNHKARFRCADPGRVDAGVRAVTAGPLHAGVIRYRGFDYYAWAEAPEEFLAAVVLNGSGELRAARGRLSFAQGDVILDPTDLLPYQAVMRDCAFGLLQVPRVLTGELAEELTGLPAADLRFEAMAPVSAAARTMLSQTAAFIHRQLLSPGITEVSTLLVPTMTRLAAAALLETFPNTAMTASYIRGPGRVAPAVVRRATAYIDAHADQPVLMAEIAASAGVSARALQYAFRRHYGITPMGYLRRVRLERAHRELQAADPTQGVTVTRIARRWGWVSPTQFAAAYRRQYGVPPSHTLNH
jgi:AraC-like DNA-binding protein